MNEGISNKKRVVMTTIGSLGDLHPYLALALEMRKHNVDPVIVTSSAYRAKVESLNIEFHPLRPTVPDLDTAEETVMVEKIMDPQRGAEYLFKELLIPAVRESYQDLQVASQRADLLITHPLVLAGPLLAQKTGLPWFSTVLAPTSLWSNYDPFVFPTAPWLYRVMRFGGPMAARVFKNLLENLTNSWLKPVYEFRQELGLPRGAHPMFAGNIRGDLISHSFHECCASHKPTGLPKL